MIDKIEYDIVPITLTHIEGFRAALDSVAQEKKYLCFLEAPSLVVTRAFVENNIKENWPQVVAIVDNNVVGWCDITSLGRPVYVHSGVLGIGVVAAYRGKGIGKALMHNTLHMAKEKGLERIEHTVREENHSAIELYRKFGFIIEGKKKNATKFDGKYGNTICMALFI